MAAILALAQLGAGPMGAFYVLWRIPVVKPEKPRPPVAAVAVAAWPTGVPLAPVTGKAGESAPAAPQDDKALPQPATPVPKDPGK